MIYGQNGNTECSKNLCVNVDISQDCLPQDCSLNPDFHYVSNGCSLHIEDFSSTTSTTIYSWSWNIAGIITLNGDQVDYVFPANGIYDICLSVLGTDFNNAECQNNICKQITIDNCNSPRQSVDASQNSSFTVK